MSTRFDAAALALCVTVTPAIASAAQTIRMEGASAGIAISKQAALDYRKQKPGAAPISAELSGSTAGLAKFCRGQLDIVSTSRPIQKGEMSSCSVAGVEYIELPIAFDAVVVVVNPRNSFIKSLSLDQLRAIWQASAQGKVRRWKQVESQWPDTPIKLYGPDTLSGESRYFNEAVLGPNEPVRGDYSVSADDRVLIQAVGRDANALSYVSLANFIANRDRLSAVAIASRAGGAAVAPTAEAIAAGRYQPFSRALFLYVNAKSLERPEVAEFAEFQITNGARLAKVARYIPLEESLYQADLGNLRSRNKGTAWNGTMPVGLTLEQLQKKQADQRG